MRLSFASFVLGTVLLASIAGCSNHNASGDTAVQASRLITIRHAGESDTKYYRNLQEVEADSTAIIEAKLIGESPTEQFITGEDGTVLDRYCVTKVQVVKAYKGKYKNNDIVEIAEPGYMEGDRYLTHEGYKMMDENGKYLLFTRTSNKGFETILGLDQGKYDLTITEPQTALQKATSMTAEQFTAADYLGEDPDHFNRLKAAVLAKYK